MKKRALKNYQRQCVIQKEKEDFIKIQRGKDELIKIYKEQSTTDLKVLKIENVHTGEINYVKPIKPWSVKEVENET